MIVRPRPTLFDILFRVRGSIVPRIAGRLTAMLAISVGAVLLVDSHPAMLVQLGAIPFTLIGLALSIFMSFRNTACFDRWWEGRKLWGDLINHSRSFARQISSLDAEAQAPLLRGLIGFAHGLAARLRNGHEASVVARWWADAPAADHPNPTDAILRDVGTRCARLARARHISDIHLSILEGQLTALSQVQGGCERIKATPLPFTFTLLLHRSAYAFCLLLPFALANALGWWTPLLVLIVCYTFFALDALGDELEDPFGLDTNDLPLDALVRLVEREMLAAMGRDDLPPPLLPERDLLL
ncbi:putative membrane protein [Sphingomonas gellani]|uniref:Putative membrane protein n=1 Tax=Sphingomonas gellani TaxID=1166340 RepID=A0A1H8AKC4_9SPHN|nr:bestrophin family protein [Sphingomonas gellani]SEM71071.1 putative membrane protein [Sphingomonas gellani]